MRAALYMKVAKTTMSRSLVREAEEVLGSGTNWSRHFHKQFHHELGLAQLSQKTLLGSHIRMMFHWIKNKMGMGVATSLTNPVPPAVPPQEENQAPMAPPAEQVEEVALVAR
ncbi:unnamed protein product [Calypogeia fissa]